MSAPEAQRLSCCGYLTRGDTIVCSAVDPPMEVDSEYVQRICMGGFWDVCPRYRLAHQEAVSVGAPKPGPLPPRGANGMRTGHRLAPLGVALQWGALIFLVVALGLFGGMLLRHRSLSFLASPLTPDSVAAVVPPTSTPTTTTLPSPSSTPSAMPSPTATSTHVPTQTPTTAASSTPTASPTATPTATATEAASRLPTSVPSQLPTPTPFRAPGLLTPVDGQRFSYNDEVSLAWTSVGILPEDAYYVITLAYPHGNQTWYDETPWLKETSWRVNEHLYLRDLSNDGNFAWSVRVMRLTGENDRGQPIGEPLGPASPQRAFYWARQPSSGGPPPTPLPPAP